MTRQRSRGRVTATLLAVFSVALPLGVSLLDAREPPTRTRVESHHDPGRCAWHHDHAACVQLAHSVAAPARGAAAATLPPRDDREAARPARSPHRSPPITTRHARAPPTPIL